MKKLFLFAVFSAYLLVPGKYAEALTLSNDPGTLRDVTSVNDTLTSLGMLGMQVTATFSGGGSEALNWALPVSGSVYDYVGSTYAGVTGSTGGSWSLYAAGNTFAALWQFTGGSDAITSLSFAGFQSNLVFDRTTTFPDYGTTGSFSGRDFTPDTNGDGFADNPNWTVTYFDAVGLNGAAPVGDLYGGLKIDFGTGGYSGNFSFLQDTDSIVPGTSVPPGGGGGTSVPEPSSLLLLGLGVVGLAFFGRNRFNMI